MSHSSTPHCSRALTERSQKKGSSSSPFYFHQRECIGFHTLPHQRSINDFNMAHQVNLKKKPISNLMGGKTIAARQEQLKVQSRNCYWKAAEGTEICAHINLFSFPLHNLHSPLLLYNKIKSLHNQNNDYQRFHWRKCKKKPPTSTLHYPCTAKLISHLFEPSTLLPKIKIKIMYFRPHATSSIEPSPLLSKSKVIHWLSQANISKIP